MTRLYENDVARVSLDESVPCLKHEWLGPSSNPNAFRDAMTHGLNGLYTLRRLVPADQPLGALIDNRRAPLLTPADHEWLADYITPRQLVAGLRFLAIVDDKSPESHANISEWQLRARFENHPFVLATFSAEAPARAWLQQALATPEAPGA